MQTYLVGGAVRDALLGLPVKDRDWVVVGADAETMIRQGFLPVGKDFPVFLHPETHEEYALARTERKTTAGYAGFTFHADRSVTLVQDLQRRDLTINAIAQDSAGRLTDPYGGQRDLQAGILRHVSPAFAEDPVRILRTARFAARYGFAVAPETMRLMRQMVENGEAAALVAERVWQELAKGLTERRPDKMIEILHRCGALAVILPETDALHGLPDWEHTLRTLRAVAADNLTLPERYAALLHTLGQPENPEAEADTAPVEAANRRWRVPKPCAELAVLVCRFRRRLDSVARICSPQDILAVLKQADALRRPERFQAALNVCRAAAQARLSDGTNLPCYPQQQWTALLDAAQSINTAAIAAQHAGSAQRIAQAVDAARTAQILPVMRHGWRKSCR